MQVYEGLILFDSKEASTKWDAFKGQVLDILKKHGAEVLRERKWSDRKLAYDIKRTRRGTYLLVHFSADPSAILPIRQDMKLAEPVIRELIIRLEVTVETFRQQMDKAESLEAPPAAPSSGEGDMVEEPKPGATAEASVAGEAEA